MSSVESKEIEELFSVTDNEKLFFEYESKFTQNWGSLKNWNWFEICQNIKIPIEFFEKYILYVDWDILSSWVPLSFVEKYLKEEKFKEKIYWSELCRNTNIPFTFFEKYLNKI